MHIVVQWMHIVAQWMHIVVQWMHIVAQWMHIVVQWMHIVAQWMHIVAQWMHIVAQWMHIVAQWFIVIKYVAPQCVCYLEAITFEVRSAFNSWSDISSLLLAAEDWQLWVNVCWLFLMQPVLAHRLKIAQEFCIVLTKKSLCVPHAAKTLKLNHSAHFSPTKESITN